MADRRSRYSSSARDKAPSIIGDSAKAHSQNFVTEFLKHCEVYDIRPVPLFKVNGDVESRISSRLSQLQRAMPTLIRQTGESEEEPPVFNLTFENPRKLEKLKTIESRDKCREISICILDAINTTMQKYTTVTTLNLPNCHINAYGIMQIAQMLTEIGCLRDVNLDMNPNLQENYDLLCKSSGNLSYLSLRLCHITDNGIRKIANELKYRDPPSEPKLIALNLAHNRITKIGAKYIASMLRTNRSLQSLVLTANKIEDVGATAIINELCMSTLTHNEIVDLRRRRYIEIEQQAEKVKENAVLQKTDKIADENQSQKSNKSSKRQSLSQASRKLSRQISFSKANEGDYNSHSRVHSVQKRGMNISKEGGEHPFRVESITLKGSVVASGNFQIQHINLSFNCLTNKILKVLISCLYYQNYMMLDDTTRGLLHVFLEGNDIRKENNEDWTTLIELLESRRQIKPMYDAEDYDQLISAESKILRKNIKARASR